MSKADDTTDKGARKSESAPSDPVHDWLGERAESPNSGLAEVQRAFTTLLENIPGMAYRCANDPQYTMEFVSGKSEELTGYKPDELCNNRVVAYGDLIHPNDREGVWAKVQDALEKHEAFQLMYRIHDRDEKVRWVYEQGCGVFADGELQALEGFITDVTKQRRIEERFSRAERMNTIGRLLEYVADDFKDQLSIVMSYGEFVKDELESRTAETDDINRVIEAANQASDLIRQLLKFGRPDSSEPELMSPNGFLHNHKDALSVVAGDDVRLEWDLKDEIGRTEIAPADLKEVLTGLVLNAREALPDGAGTIRICTDRVTVDEGEAFDYPEMKPGEYLTITVADDGEGMDDQRRKRAFEPYFSTKESSSGEKRRGMGLTTAYALVRQMGGHIRLESEPGERTEATVYLPRVTEEGVETWSEEPRTSAPT